MTREDFLRVCDDCPYNVERLFYSSTARYCLKHEEFCHDMFLYVKLLNE